MREVSITPDIKNTQKLWIPLAGKTMNFKLLACQMLFASITSMTWTYPYHFTITVIVCALSEPYKFQGTRRFSFNLFSTWCDTTYGEATLYCQILLKYNCQEFLPLAILAWDHGKLSKKYNHCPSWQWWCINKRSNTVLFIYLCMPAFLQKRGIA